MHTQSQPCPNRRNGKIKSEISRFVMISPFGGTELVLDILEKNQLHMYLPVLYDNKCI
jgi:hypothetical protein